MTFAWSMIRPRLPKPTLYCPKLREGLGFPNFAVYYKAAHVEHLPKYHAVKETPLSVTIESMDCDPLSISNLLWPRPADRINRTNPVTKHSLLLWDKFKTPYGLQSSHSPLLSFLKNPAFYPAWYSPTAFWAWNMAGLIHLQNMVTRTLLLSFQAICESSGLPQSEFF